VPPLPRLLLVADDPIARAGLRALSERSGLSVTGEASADELQSSQLDDCDAIVWDVGAGASLDALRTAAPRAPVLALPWSAEQARDALAAGARGALSRERLAEQLLPSVQAVVQGLLVLDDAFAETVVRPAAGLDDALVEPLTPREAEVLQLLAEGLSNRRLGERLGISEHTAKFHVNAILGKLGARTRAEAIAQAARLGLLVL